MSEERTILVVDDEQDIVETLDFALRRRGFKVRIAKDGNEALESALQDPPDLMLLDVMMPGCNGYEVSRKLKEWMRTDIDQERSFPILLVTARRLNDPDREEFVATWSQADGVLYKPFGLRRLVERVEEFLPAAAASA